MVSWVRGECVGKGCFGTVNLGVNVSDGHVFAVKSVDRNSGLASHVEALENEIRILRSLSSPYVVGYLGDDVTYESPTTSYRNLHMEYLPGGTVTDVAKRRCCGGVADVEERIVRSHTWCLVSALRYLHSRGIVHCDVKGRNILLGPDCNLAKLADFGSSIEVSVDTCKGPIMPRGSPLWMAPEVIRRESQGPESDVWSLGCTVMEMITGKPAWEDRGVDTLSRIGFSDESPELPSGLSELGRDFLEKCLIREPSKRWSCDQLLQHPFLSSASPNPVTVTDTSPRCVLDWVNSEFLEDDEENELSLNTNSHELSARERIGELATTSGANWESSDGWVVVRALVSAVADDTEAAAGTCCCGDKEWVGTSTEYQDLMRTKEEIAGTTIAAYSDSQSLRTRLEYSNSSGGNLLGLGWHYNNNNNNNYCACGLSGWSCGGCICNAGLSCRHGSQKADFAVESQGTSFNSLSTVLLLLFLYLTVTLMYKLLFLLFTYYSWPQFYACQITKDGKYGKKIPNDQLMLFGTIILAYWVGCDCNSRRCFPSR
jgi:serine/threonine protein kinase